MESSTNHRAIHSLRSASVRKSSLLSDSWRIVVIFGIAMAIRAAVGLHPYSGENTPPKFGDFEAQRHWMELAINVPAQDWYRNTDDNDLSYWGLDYPPLSGYVSYIAGRFLALVDPAAIALGTSHGFEMVHTRAAMRATVLLADAFVFFPALSLFARTTGAPFRISSLVFCVTLPALIIVDHGHFQYNSFSLGLFIFSITSYLSDYDTLGAIFFCLSIYFKHMGLYYALVVFAMHVSRAAHIAHSQSLIRAVVYTLQVLTAIAAVTMFTFWPWISDVKSMTQVKRRLFPVSRGLYEDKVANVWCSISIILKLNRLLSRESLVLLCAIMTCVASLPFSAAALRKRSVKTLLLSVSGCALSSYLFAFQVHEKQILLPLMPLALLFDTCPRLCVWMSLAASASLFPLLVREGLVLPYVVLTLMQGIIVLEFWPHDGERDRTMMAESKREWIKRLSGRMAMPVFLVGVVLHVALLVLTPPDFAPDILVLLLTGFSCAIFCGVYTAMIVDLWMT